MSHDTHDACHVTHDMTPLSLQGSVTCHVGASWTLRATVAEHEAHRSEPLYRLLSCWSRREAA
jgi:hypothetical protein